MFEHAWVFVFERSFHEALTAAKEALANGTLFRKGQGARCAEESADEDGAIEAEPEEGHDVGLLCEDADEDEEE